MPPNDSTSRKPPSHPIRAVVFDLDGVLVDSEPLGYRIVNDMLAEYAVTMVWEDYVSIIGTTVSPWDLLIEKHELPRTRQEFSNLFWQELERRVVLGELTALPGAVDAVTAVRPLGLRLALASSSNAITRSKSFFVPPRKIRIS